MATGRWSSLRSLAQPSGSNDTTQQKPDELDDCNGYRVMYHVEKFTACWRNLVLFYLAMFIAGYAKVVDVCLFWGAVAALLLVYWEPYLSPAFPWNIPGKCIHTTITALDEQHILSTVPKWGTLPDWMASRTPATEEQRQALLQWLHCLVHSLPYRQQLVHRLIQSSIMVPCAAMGVGVVRQVLYFPLRDEKAMCYSAILFTLVLIYTLLTVGVNIVFLWVLKHKLKAAAAAAAEPQYWQPQDMMHFLCKILGQCLNTVVQTLVAGAFVEYMPMTIFWLGAVVTGMSYTATNLLYDMGPARPVQKGEVDAHWIANSSCFGCITPQLQPKQCSDGPMCPSSGMLSSGSLVPTPNASSNTMLASAVSLTPPVRSGAAVDSASSAYGANYVSNKITTSLHTCDDVALTMDCGEDAVKITGNKLAGRQNSQSANCELHNEKESCRRSSRKGNYESPPFLLYRWPRGMRGWSIIALLIGQAGPCIAILTMLVVGQKMNMPELYIYRSGTGSECDSRCRMRYEQLLYALACLGIITCYYAITIGFLGCGPVTFVYRCIHHGRCMPAARQKLPETNSSTYGADAC